MSTCVSGQSYLSIAHGAQDQVPSTQLERGPNCWSMAVAGTHVGIFRQRLPLPSPQDMPSP